MFENDDAEMPAPSSTSVLSLCSKFSVLCSFAIENKNVFSFSAISLFS